VTPVVMVAWQTGLQIESTLAGADASMVTTRDITLPSAPAGRVLALVYTSAATRSPTAPTGWELAATRNDGGSNRVYVRATDGTEGDTLTVVTSSAVRAAWVVYEVSGVLTTATDWYAARWDGNLTGTSLSSPWGDTVDSLLVTAARSGWRTDNTFTKPARFGNQVDIATGEAELEEHCRLATAHRIASVTSDTAGEWTSTGTLTSACSALLMLRGVA
jgi:hypothetical protein